jgi:hypothetical protein
MGLVEREDLVGARSVMLRGQGDASRKPMSECAPSFIHMDVCLFDRSIRGPLIRSNDN